MILVIAGGRDRTFSAHHDVKVDQKDAKPVCRNVCRSGMYPEVFRGPTRPCMSTKTAGPHGPAVFGDRCSLPLVSHRRQESGYRRRAAYTRRPWGSVTRELPYV